MNRTQYRIFISSPGDLKSERELAEHVIQRVDESLPGVQLQCYLSERIPYFAHQSPQEGIPLSSEFDLVVCLFWKRMGSELLPDKFDAIDANGTSRKRTGSEFEFETAIEAARRNQATTNSGVPVPGVLVYHKTAHVQYDADKVDEQRAQHQALQNFFQRWIKTPEGHYVGYAKGFANAGEFERQFERHLRDWLSMQRRAADWDVATKGPPFRGLEVFEAAHESIYFGRDRAILQASAKLEVAAQAGFPVLWMVGASGSGKSSLLRAGLLPRLERIHENLRPLLTRPSDWGLDWAQGLAEQLLASIPELRDGSFRTSDTIANVLRAKDPSIATEVLRTALQSWASRCLQRDADAVPLAQLLLALDQAEELLSLRTLDERQAISRLLQAWTDAGLCLLVLTFRSDFYASLQQDGTLLALKARAEAFDIAAPSPAEVAEMIEGPCRAAGLTLEVSEGGESLRDDLARDCHSPDSLPMLQFALTALYQQAQARQPKDEQDNCRKVLTLASYKAIGGAAGALSQAAEAALAGLPSTVQTRFPRLLFELVKVDRQSDRKPAAKNCPDSVFASDLDMETLITALVKYRLLTRFDLQGKSHIRVVHESLFEQWPRARELIVDNVRRLDAKRRVEEAYALWRAQPSNKRLLIGLALEEGLDLVKTKVLLPEAIIFVERSIRHAKSRARTLVTVFASLALLLGIVAFAFLLASKKAEKNAANAKASAEVAEAGLRQAAERALGRARDSGDRYSYALNLTESLELMPEVAQDEAAIALQHLPSPRLRNVFIPPSAQVTKENALWPFHKSVAVSKDRSVFITANESQYSVWNLSTGENPLNFRSNLKSRHSSWPMMPALELSPSGNFVVALNVNEAQLWRVSDGMKLGKPLKHSDPILSVAISEDGSLIATTDESGATLWDSKSGKKRAELPEDSIAVTFSPDDSIILGISDFLYVSQTSSGKLLEKHDLGDQGEFFPTGDFSRTGAKFAAVQKYQAHVFEVRGDTLKSVAAIDTNNESAEFGLVKFGPDERVLAVGYLESELPIGLHNSNNGKQVAEIPITGLRSFDFSSDGLLLAVGLRSGFVEVWSTNGPSRLDGFNVGCTIANTFFVRENRTIMVACSDSTVSLWDTFGYLSAPAKVRNPYWDDYPTNLAVSHEKNFLLVNSFGLELWDLKSIKVLLSNSSSSRFFNSLKFDPGGDTILARGESDTLFKTESLVGENFFTGRQRYAPTLRNRVSWMENSGRLSDERTGEVLYEFTQPEPIKDIIFSANGKSFVSISDNAAYVRSLTSSSIAKPIKVLPKSSIAISPFGTAIVVTSPVDGDPNTFTKTELWASDGTKIDLGLEIEEWAFGADTSEIIVAANDSLAWAAWDLGSNKKISGGNHGPMEVRSVQINAQNSRILLSGSFLETSRSELVDLNRARHINDFVGSAKFDPSGTRFITINEHRVQMWESDKGSPVGVDISMDGRVGDVLFSEEGSKLVIVEGNIERSSDLLDFARKTYGSKEPYGLWRSWSGGYSVFATETAKQLGAAITASDLRLFAGGSVGDSGEVARLNAFELQKLSDDIRKSKGESRKEVIMRWHLVDPSARTISPFSSVTTSEFVIRQIDWIFQTDEDKGFYRPDILYDAYRIDPGHPLILVALGFFEDAETRKLWTELSIPRITAHPEFAAYAAWILAKGGDAVNAKQAAEIALKHDPANEQAKFILAWAGKK